MKAKEVMERLQKKYGHEKEYLQAVHEVLKVLKKYTTNTPSLKKQTSWTALWNRTGSSPSGLPG